VDYNPLWKKLLGTLSFFGNQKYQDNAPTLIQFGTLAGGVSIERVLQTNVVAVAIHPLQKISQKHA